MEPITQRDVHIAVEMADGTTLLARRRNPDTTAWELWAAAHNLDAGKAPTLSLTYQAWHALRRTGTRVGKFDDWAADVDEVYPAGSRVRQLLNIAMSYPGLPAPWLLTVDDRVIDTIIDLHEETQDA